MKPNHPTSQQQTEPELEIHTSLTRPDKSARTIWLSKLTTEAEAAKYKKRRTFGIAILQLPVLKIDFDCRNFLFCVDCIISVIFKKISKFDCYQSMHLWIKQAAT